MTIINNKPLLSFIMPTKDRPDVVGEYLQITRDIFLNYNINLYIMDGNDNNLTYQVYKKYKSDKIFYVKMPDIGLRRISHGIKISNSEYICISADKYIPLPEKIDRVIEFLKKGYDIIEFTNRDHKNIGMKEYSSPRDMCIDCAWDATMFGYVFIKRSSYKPLNYEEFYDKYAANPLWYVPYYFDYVVDNNSFRGLYVPEEINTSPKSINTGSSWHNKEQFFKVWAVDWKNAINTISFIDEADKRKVILDHAIYGLELISLRSWYGLRIRGILDGKTYKQYESEIKQMTTINYKYIVLLALTPVIILKLAAKINKIIRSVLKIFSK